MKRFLFRIFVIIPILIFSASPFSVSQASALETGNLFGIHLMTVTLKPGVRMEQFQGFFVAKVLPEYEKQWPEIKGYLLKSFSPKSKNSFAVVWLFKSVAARNKYFTPGGKANALELKAREGVKPIEAELKAKFGSYTVKYTDEDDWVVQ